MVTETTRSELIKDLMLAQNCHLSLFLKEYLELVLNVKSISFLAIIMLSRPLICVAVSTFIEQFCRLSIEMLTVIMFEKLS